MSSRPMRGGVLSMCDKCDELDGKIEHYRKLAWPFPIELWLRQSQILIKEMGARKVQLHPEQKR